MVPLAVPCIFQLSAPLPVSGCAGMSLEHEHLALKGAYAEVNLLVEISPAPLLPRPVGAPVIHIS